MSELNIASWVRDEIQQELARLFFRATVTGTSGNKVVIQPQTQSGTTTLTAARLSSYSSPQNGDEVLGIYIPDGHGGYSPFVLGKPER